LAQSFNIQQAREERFRSDWLLFYFE
jgi:hypothetical protein